MTALPPLLLLTDRFRAEQAGESLRQVLVSAVEAGARGIVVRERDLPLDERAALVGFVDDLLAGLGGLVVVAAPPVAEDDDVHLRAADPVPPARPAVVGRSCHDAAELRAAADEGCDYATLSPIFATASKPGYGPDLGPAALAGAPLPTYALGGLTPANAAACIAAGATGVAVMGGVMGAADPGVVVADLLAALEGTS